MQKPGINDWKELAAIQLTTLRANVGIYRESQISFKTLDFGLYYPNNPLIQLFQEVILRNP